MLYKRLEGGKTRLLGRYFIIWNDCEHGLLVSAIHVDSRMVFCRLYSGALDGDQPAASRPSSQRTLEDPEVVRVTARERIGGPTCVGNEAFSEAALVSASEEAYVRHAALRSAAGSWPSRNRRRSPIFAYSAGAFIILRRQLRLNVFRQLSW